MNRNLTAIAALAVMLCTSAGAGEPPEAAGETLELEEPAVIVEPWVPPEVLEEADLQYPPERYDEGLDVKVIVRVDIDEAGNVKKASVFTSGGSGFDEAALEAARRWKFKPALENGVPAKSYAMIYVVFDKTMIPLWEEDVIETPEEDIGEENGEEP
jgi:vitamin B12 transporter